MALACYYIKHSPEYTFIKYINPSTHRGLLLEGLNPYFIIQIGNIFS